MQLYVISSLALFLLYVLINVIYDNRAVLDNLSLCCCTYWASVWTLAIVEIDIETGKRPPNLRSFLTSHFTILSTLPELLPISPTLTLPPKLLDTKPVMVISKKLLMVPMSLLSPLVSHVNREWLEMIYLKLMPELSEIWLMPVPGMSSIDLWWSVDSRVVVNWQSFDL